MSIAQIEAASAKSDTPEGFNRLIHLVTFVGGVDSLPPGGKATVVFDLRTPGQYGLHTALADNTGHDTLFSVAPASRQDAATPADVTVTLKDMAFLGLPRHLAAGTVTFKLTNRGHSVHHMILMRLDPGKAMRDVMNALKKQQQPSWAHDAGGMDLLSPHQTAWLTLDLIPGNYVALCFLPDPMKGGVPRVEEGMGASFTVS
jgi:hypothetical protein